MRAREEHFEPTHLVVSVVVARQKDKVVHEVISPVSDASRSHDL